MLYLECASGISGDMTVAALLDLGADEQVLRKALASLPVDGFQIRISRVVKNGLDACDFQVLLDGIHENHDHDMDYLHGSDHGSGHYHDHQGDHGQNDGHPHSAHAHHIHRGLPEILEIIRQADMTERAKGLAEKIFRILAQAEAKAHGVPLGQVHFHEVGAVDSIVDILAAAVCLDDLGITEVIIPRLCEGTGTVRCQHGILPVPVPAVLNIIQEHGLPLTVIPVEGELVTPTGAAIAAAIRTAGGLPERFFVKKTGIGAGKRAYACPGILRAMLLGVGEIQDGKTDTHGDTVYKLEANIDDCTGEQLGYAMECLFQAGVKDVHYTPVFMKKNRPAYQLNVICDEKDVPRAEEIIFRETTTIGIRRMKIGRSVLQREVREVETSLGRASVKICSGSMGRWIYPEYESIARLARQHGLPYGQAERRVIQETAGQESRYDHEKKTPGHFDHSEGHWSGLI